MSIQAIAWVLEHSEATLAERLVLLAIANHADARGWNAYPSIPLIGAEARVGRTTVYRAIESLEDSGELAIIRRPGRSSMYGIAALKDGRGSQIGTGEGSQIGTQGVPNTRKRGPNLGPKPYLTVKEPSRARAREAPAPHLPPELPGDVRARGAEYFRALRKGEAS